MIRTECLICGNPTRLLSANFRKTSGEGKYCSNKCRGLARRNSEEDLWAQYLVSSTGCWEFTGHRTPSGYGQLYIARKLFTAHRLSFTLTYGPIPPGMFVCHSCDNPKCINPEHLFLGTPKDNAEDRDRKKRNNLPCGEKHVRSKLTEDKVKYLLHEVLIKGRPQRHVAKEIGISVSVASTVILNRSWKHIERPKI